MNICQLGSIVGNRCDSIAQLVAPQVQVAQQGEVLVHIVVLNQLSNEFTIGKIAASTSAHSYMPRKPVASFITLDTARSTPANTKAHRCKQSSGLIPYGIADGKG